MSFDAVVVGGGPAGATVAETLSRKGWSVALIERGHKIKPCGGAVPPRLIRDFAIPDELIVARIASARMIAPSGRHVDMPIEGGYVGMVDRGPFDEWLRSRAERSGCIRIEGRFLGFDEGGEAGARRLRIRRADGAEQIVTGRLVVGADGANSAVARATFGERDKPPFVFAYHEIVSTEATAAAADAASRCDVFYQGAISPDFYGWVFPHGKEASIGMGSARKGVCLKDRTRSLREASGYGQASTVRCEGAPIPYKVRRRWDDGKNVIVVGDAAGVVAPASGEGIYYAMESGRIVADACAVFLRSGEAAALREARKQFLKDHGSVFTALRVLQAIWYRSDWLRERFVAICTDPDVQRLTWESYMNKKMAKADHTAHARIFWQNLSHYFGWRSA